MYEINKLKIIIMDNIDNNTQLTSNQTRTAHTTQMSNSNHRDDRKQRQKTILVMMKYICVFLIVLKLLIRLITSLRLAAEAMFDHNDIFIRRR